MAYIPFGIDTLHISVKDFAVLGNNNLTISPCRLTPKFPRQKTLLYCVEKVLPNGDIISEPVYGQEATYDYRLPNRNHVFHVEICKDRYDSGVICYINISSLSLLIDLNNLLPCHSSMWEIALINLNDLLENEAGIKCDLGKATIHRLDIAKNILLDFPFKTYFPIIRLFRPPVLTTRNEHDNSIRFGNSRRSVIFYDKANQMAKQELTDVPSNLMRVEYEIKGLKNIKEALGFDTINGLLACPSSLEECFIDFVRKRFFRYDIGDPEVDETMRLTEELLASKEKYGRNYMSEYFKEQGLERSIHKYSSDQLFNALLLAENLSSKKTSTTRKINRTRKEYEKIVVARLQHTQHPDELYYEGDLYNELSRKILDETYSIPCEDEEGVWEDHLVIGAH